MGIHPGNILFFMRQGRPLRQAAELVEAHGYTCRVVASRVRSVAALEEEAFDAMLVDVSSMAELDLSWIEVLESTRPGVAMVVVLPAGMKSPPAVIERAFVILREPLEPAEAARAVMRAADHQRASSVRSELERHSRHRSALDAIVEASPAMTSVARGIAQAASCDRPVLVLAEDDSGEHAIAELIHLRSRRASGPLLSHLLVGGSSDLLSLFGSSGGMATTHGRGPSPFQCANGGTLVLSFVDPPEHEIQRRLVHYLDTGESLRFLDGCDRADARVIVSCNPRIFHALEADLRARLAELTIRVPPLRERPGDIPALALIFAQERAEALRRPIITGIEADAMAELMVLPWHGNLRQLRAMMEWAVLRAKGPTITRRDLEPALAVSE